MLAAALSLWLVVGLSSAGLTSTLVAALHVGSKRSLAGFDALSGVPHARALEESADSWFEISKKLLRSNLHTFQLKYQWFWNLQEAAVKPLIASQQSPGGCRESIYTLFQLNIDGFGISRKLL